MALPYLLAMVAMVLLGMSSDRSGERVWPCRGLRRFAGALGMLGAVLLSRARAGDRVASAWPRCGIYAALAVFWTLPTAILRGTAAAGGLALLNSFSNLGGFFGPDLMGWAEAADRQLTRWAWMLLAGMLVLAGVSRDADRAGVFPDGKVMSCDRRDVSRSDHGRRSTPCGAKLLPTISHASRRCRDSREAGVPARSASGRAR